MTLAFGAVLRSASIGYDDALVIRHAYVRDNDSDVPGIHAASTDAEILQYTSHQSAKPRIFPTSPPRIWVAFLPEGVDRGRLWSVLENRGETSNDGPGARSTSLSPSISQT